MKNEINLEKMDFLIRNHPNIEIVSASTGWVVSRAGEGEGEADLSNQFSFITKEALDAENNEREWETLRVTLKCKDYGPKLPQKYVYFTGCGQIFSDNAEDSILDYDLNPPTVVFPLVEDKDGFFYVTLSIAVDETLEGDKPLCEKLLNDETLLLLMDAHFSNGFVTENVGSLIISLSPEGEKITIAKEGISYALDDFGENEENANETV